MPQESTAGRGEFSVHLAVKPQQKEVDGSPVIVRIRMEGGGVEQAIVSTDQRLPAISLGVVR